MLLGWLYTLLCTVLPPPPILPNLFSAIPGAEAGLEEEFSHAPHRAPLSLLPGLTTTALIFTAASPSIYHILSLPAPSPLKSTPRKEEPPCWEGGRGFAHTPHSGVVEGRWKGEDGACL